MSGKKIKQDLAAEKQALDLYFDSLYDDTVETEICSPDPVVSLVSKSASELRNSLSESGSKDLLNLLIFTISGVKMAVSTDELDDVADWTDQISPVPDNMPLYLGLLKRNGRQIPIVDLARLVLPERVFERRKPGTCQKILIVGDYHWGLGCDDISSKIVIDNSEVNWRSDRNSRKWLAGMISSQGSALIDMNELQGMLSPG